MKACGLPWSPRNAGERRVSAGRRREVFSGPLILQQHFVAGAAIAVEIIEKSERVRPVTAADGAQVLL
jgi:hypothetical protein